MHCFFSKVYIKSRSFCLLFSVFLCLTPIFSQVQQSVPDTLTIHPDSVSQSKKTSIDAPIAYQAADSIVFYADGKGFLYGKGTVNYKETELKADYIEMDMDSSQVYASGKPDSSGVMAGYPVFKDGGEAYESHAIKYNFKSKRGYINYAVTKQGEGYVVSDKTKKTDDDILYMKDGKYTTCSDHEHPHFYLNLTKAKVKPKSYIVTGPAYLVIEDVPLPLAIPFGFFPFTESYSSGILMPSYGDELTRGFYLKDGGYYFAINDYFDFALTGDIYTKGSWALRGASSYVKRYKYNGSFSANYLENILGERELPDYSISRGFSIVWKHNQDAKANIYRTMLASVNFSTSSYERNNVDSYSNSNLLSQNTKSSSVSIIQCFPDSPWTIGASMSANQRTKDSTINLNLPDLNLTMSRIYLLKKKNSVGKDRWYEKISMSYSGRFENSITSKENELKNASFSKDWQKAVKHSIPVSASFTVFKYLTVTPSFNYNERWYFSSIHKSWDPVKDAEIIDTTYSFNRVYDYNFGVSTQTKFYGFFKPIPSIFGDKINIIRWVLTPTLGYSMNPDFGAEKYGYWNVYERPISKGDFLSYEKVYYSPYSGSMFGVPGMGRSGSVNFSLGNNLEMKVKSRRDSTEQFKKISLIDNLNVNGAYNLVADSMNWSNFNANLRLKFSDKFGINLSGAFDPYEYELNYDDRPVRVNKLRWDHGRMPQLISTSTSFGYAFSNQTFKKKTNKSEEDAKVDEKTVEDENESEGSLLSAPKEETTMTESGYQKFELPWSLRFDYSLRYGRNEQSFNKEKMQYNMSFSHNVSFSGSLSLTAKWKFSFSSSYDITNDEITYTNCNITRDLHCWSMTASFVPIGLYKSYNVRIAVKSSLLQDLKYEQRGNSYDGVW